MIFEKKRTGGLELQAQVEAYLDVEAYLVIEDDLLVMGMCQDPKNPLYKKSLFVTTLIKSEFEKNSG